ncbi:MAG: arginyltransferase [Candidatus Hydrogenedentes bacterium]|nr:arginyltransferase [Candidatus Hydrogenedentota bacterium]
MTSTPAAPQPDDPQRFAERMERACYLGHLDGPCPYLPGRAANHLFLDGRPIGNAYRTLLDAGYRRHGRVLYRTDCDSCHLCQIIRVPLASFRPNRSQRRTWRQGKLTFDVRLAAPSYDPEKAAMYHRYLVYQHGYSGEPIDEERYTDFFVSTFLGSRTVELQLHAEGCLAGVGILDRVGDVLSAVYFYYEPEFARYGPGTYAILKEIELAREWGHAYFYPGYYIGACAAMSYKTNFRPCQIKNANSDAWTEVR